MTDLLSDLETPAEMPGGLPNVEEDDDRFNWIDGESIVIEEQMATAVYRNRTGGVVIRQEGAAYDRDDMFVTLRDEAAVRVLIAALQRELKGAGR